MEQTPIITLPSAATIENAASIAELFLNETSLTSETVTLDASHIEIITTPGVQLILALAASVQTAGGKLRILNPTDAFVRNFETLGFGHTLNEWRN